jgi:hypothetical protein
MADKCGFSESTSQEPWVKQTNSQQGPPTEDLNINMPIEPTMVEKNAYNDESFMPTVNDDIVDDGDMVVDYQVDTTVPETPLHTPTPVTTRSGRQVRTPAKFKILLYTKQQ